MHKQVLGTNKGSSRSLSHRANFAIGLKNGSDVPSIFALIHPCVLLVVWGIRWGPPGWHKDDIFPLVLAEG